MDRVVIELEAEHSLRVPRLRNGVVVCLEGALWITLRDNPTDITLERGASCRLSGLDIFIEAVRPSRIALETLAEDARVGFARLSTA